MFVCDLLREVSVLLCPTSPSVHVCEQWSPEHALLLCVEKQVDAVVNKQQFHLFLQTRSLFLPQLLRSNPFPT